MKKAPKKEAEVNVEPTAGAPSRAAEFEAVMTEYPPAPAVTAYEAAKATVQRSVAPDPVPYVAPYKSDIVTKEAFWRAVSELGHDLYQHPKEHAYADKYVATLAEKLGFQP